MANLISAMMSIYDFVMTQFAIVFQTILDNPILFLPVLLGLFGSIVFFVIKIIRKMGVRGKRG